jgi:hypothetical protein
MYKKTASAAASFGSGTNGDCTVLVESERKSERVRCILFVFRKFVFGLESFFIGFQVRLDYIDFLSILHASERT